MRYVTIHLDMLRMVLLGTYSDAMNLAEKGIAV